MKTATATQRKIAPAIPYPNAATPQDTLNKAVDFLLISAMSLGITASILFLLALLA